MSEVFEDVNDIMAFIQSAKEVGFDGNINSPLSCDAVDMLISEITAGQKAVEAITDLISLYCLKTDCAKCETIIIREENCFINAHLKDIIATYQQSKEAI